MAKNSLSTIEEFLKPKKFALIGLSRDPKKFSRAVFKELTAKGYEIYPVNPNMDDVEGVKCFHRISEVPGDIKQVLFMTPKESTAAEIKAALDHGMTHIWIQQGAETKEAVELVKGHDSKLIYGACIMMHGNPSGVHKFHRMLSKLFGAFPKN